MVDCSLFFIYLGEYKLEWVWARSGYEQRRSRSLRDTIAIVAFALLQTTAIVAFARHRTKRAIRNGNV